jgi:hypothetical protein
MTRTERRREADARTVAEKLARLPEDERGLPMPLDEGTTAKLSRQEWIEYRERRAWHLQRFPEYDAGWARPSVETAEAVWRLLETTHGREPESLIPDYGWPASEERCELVITAKQALVVVLDCAVQAGWQEGKLKFDDTGHQKRRSIRLTFNKVFDALAMRWSDHYRLAATQRRVSRVCDMLESTAWASWRDLLRNGVRLGELWDLVVGEWSSSEGGRNPLFRLTRLRPAKKGNGGGGYMVDLPPGSGKLDEFERIVSRDPHYRRRYRGWRLLLANKPTPARKPKQEICAERPYNVVKVGARSEKLLAIMERTQLVFNAAAFQRDLGLFEGRVEEICRRLWDEHKIDPTKSRWRGRSSRRARLLLKQYEKVRGTVTQFRSVDQQLRSLPNSDEWIPIHTGFQRVLNRRYQPTDFWPSEVSGKLDEPRQIADDIEASSERGRWFACADPNQDEDLAFATWELTGFDVSSSQTQIMSVLLGIDDLERHATSSEKPFKRYLARHAWDTPGLREGYTEDADKWRFVDLVKNLWMRVLYGSKVRRVVRDQSKEPEVYGPGWTVEQADQFLASLPWFEDVQRFLDACRRIAEIAYEADPCRGVVFTDPFDYAEVRWNPVKRKRRTLSSDGRKLILSLPVGKPNPEGDYPVDLQKMKRKVAPCLVHMLDAYFAGLVIERLAAHGVRDFVSIHDCWLVPAGVKTNEGPKQGRDVLADCIRDAGAEWLKGLGPVYDRLVAYLGDDPGYGDFVRAIKAKWEDRVRRESWPVFAAPRSQLSVRTTLWDGKRFGVERIGPSWHDWPTWA